MKFQLNDGGRAAAGFKGTAGDCVARAIAIATEQPYEKVYQALADVNASTRQTSRRTKSAGRRSARNGIYVRSPGFKRYMRGLGWVFVATMGIGTGCTVHLTDGELPMGRLVVQVSKHSCAVIDGVIHDSHDPQRNGSRCVYGYWKKA